MLCLPLLKRKQLEESLSQTPQKKNHNVALLLLQVQVKKTNQLLLKWVIPFYMVNTQVLRFKLKVKIY